MVIPIIATTFVLFYFVLVVPYARGWFAYRQGQSWQHQPLQWLKAGGLCIPRDPGQSPFGSRTSPTSDRYSLIACSILNALTNVVRPFDPYSEVALIATVSSYLQAYNQQTRICWPYQTPLSRRPRRLRTGNGGHYNSWDAPGDIGVVTYHLLQEEAGPPPPSPMGVPCTQLQSLCPTRCGTRCATRSIRNC